MAFDDVYFLNAGSSRDRRYLMSELFEKASGYSPQGLLLSNFLKRLRHFSDLRVGGKVTSKLNFGMNANARVRIDVGGDSE
ncbi:hypothetical protein [Emticicia sp. BO119]|uniref:hypothetical protein n=1 Tax=Emticicia sp. BO119 TaxID=2757768 RepID=UPI0015F09E4A|nr:hypothetical protein [Emticicia sp. BO119]MBA4850489.1 hypothetical protein [Emticicia sp. BO119]